MLPFWFSRASQNSQHAKVDVIRDLGSEGQSAYLERIDRLRLRDLRRKGLNLVEIPGISGRISNDQEIGGGRSKRDRVHDFIHPSQKGVRTGETNLSIYIME